MPAKSKSQQKLFQIVLGVRQGKIKREDVSKTVLDIVDGPMTDEQIEHFTVLKEDIMTTPQNTLGMGAVNINGGPDIVKTKHDRHLIALSEYILKHIDRSKRKYKRY